MKSYIEEHIDLSQVDYISGGERRDWYFSNIIQTIQIVHEQLLQPVAQVLSLFYTAER